jgi:tetratricopeptide (TPR) repeat protein|tara:strand:+ start:124 stop:1626 length:1503 start_codon:yes stop_codon:yes gene_type:complete
MNKLFNVIFITAFVFSACSKKPVVKLPITTSSSKALEYYNKAMSYQDVGEGFESKTDLDSAIALDPNFAMAIETYPTQDPLVGRKNREKVDSLVNKLSKAEQLMIKINRSYRDKNMDIAIETANKLVELHSDSYESYLWLGQVQSDRNEIDEAIGSIKKAIELNPESYEAYDILIGHQIPMGDRVMLPQERRDTDLGSQYADELIRIRPDAGQPYHWKANIYRQLGEFEKAKPFYEKAIEKRNGKSAEGTSYNVSAHNYMFSGDFKTARESYKKAISLTKTDWWKFQIEFYLTVSYMFENDYIGAIENIDKVEENLDRKKLGEITFHQMKGWLYFQKFICYAHNQMEEDAFDAVKQRLKYQKISSELIGDEIALREAESNEAYLTAWANILFGKYDKAKPHLKRLKTLKEKINDPTAMYGYYGLLGMTNLMEHNYNAAVESFQKSDRNDIYFNYFEGLSLKANGQENEAKKAFQVLEKINFSNWDIAIVRRLAKKQLGGS